MIAALLFAAQTMVTGAPPLAESRPATDWACDFTGADGTTFKLSGSFAEAPVGSDPNRGFPTVIEGDGPVPLVGKSWVKAFASYPEVRTYQTGAYAKDGSNYVTTFTFMRGEELGLATITRYVPDPVTKRGTLAAFAVGHCRATFHPAGHGAPAK